MEEEGSDQTLAVPILRALWEMEPLLPLGRCELNSSARITELISRLLRLKTSTFALSSTLGEMGRLCSCTVGLTRLEASSPPVDGRPSAAKHVEEHFVLAPLRSLNRACLSLLPGH